MIEKPSVEDELLRLKQVELALLRQKEEIVRANRIAFWRPNSPKQHQFFENAHRRRRAIFAGNRFGKSTVGTAEDASWLLGYRPWYPEGHPLRTLGIPRHGVKGLVVAENWDKVHEIFTNDDATDDRIGKIFWFLPKWSIKHKRRNSMGVIDTITVHSQNEDGSIRESIICFDTVSSFRTNGLSHESSDWDFAHFDEPVPREMYVAISRGFIDRGGSAWFLLTPLSQPWIYDEFVEPPAGQEEHYWHAVADMDENPDIDQAEKNLFLAGLSEEEKECRKKGLPLAYGNLVYPLFNRAKHVRPIEVGPPKGWKDWLSPPRDYLVTVAIDPHPQTPHAVLFTAVGPEHVFFYNELFAKCSIKELAAYIREQIAHVRLEAIICDPIAWITNPDTGRCWADTLIEEGLDVQRASNEKTAGIIQTNEIFRDTYPKKIQVAPHMKHFLKEIQKYFYGKENKPVDKDDHLMECLYRTVMHNGLQWYPESPSGGVSTTYNDNITDYSL